MKWQLLTLGALGLLSLGGSTINLGGGATSVSSSGGGGRSAPNNIVAIVLDDWGYDQSTLFYGASPALTPKINVYAATGVRYSRMVSAPNCSPSRVSALTGLYPHNNHVGFAVAGTDPAQFEGLDPAVPTVADILHNHGYTTIAIGKSHMAGIDYGPDRYAFHMHQLGFDHYEGNPVAAVSSYSSGAYTWVLDDETYTTPATYVTEYTTDRAIAMRPVGGAPFFMWVAYNAPHGPIHCPPDAQTPTYDAVCTPIGGETANQAKFHAMLEAADVQVDRFIGTLDLATTTVFIIGDNGTNFANGECIGYISTKCKLTSYMGGVGVPLFVFGNGVTTTGESKAPLNIADFAKTFLSVAGINPNELSSAVDSLDFKSTFSNTAARPREINFAEGFKPNGTAPIDPTTWVRSAGDSRYHLVKLTSGTEEFYDLDVDQFEAAPLNLGTLTAPQQTAYNALKAKINSP